MPLQVSLDHIDKVFDETWALKQVSSQFNMSERITIVGHNGAGKSTILSIVATIMNPTRGSVSFSNQEGVVSDRIEIRRRMSFLSHAAMMYPDLTALENLQFFAGLYDVKGVDYQAQLEKVGMRHAENILFRACSRGMQQRLSFVRALLAKPQLLLLDEPFSGLDHKGIQRLKSILIDDYEGGWLLVTHDMSQGYELADRFWIFKRGRLAQDLKKSDVSFKQYVSLCETNLPDEVLL